MRIHCLQSGLPVLAVVTLLGFATTGISDDGFVYLDQGWDASMRQQFYETSIESEMLPFAWFVALECADRPALFRSESNTRRFGYLPHGSSSGRHSDSLPIGFVKGGEPASFELTRGFLKAGVTSQKFRELISAISKPDALTRNADGLLNLPDFEPADVDDILSDVKFAKQYEQNGAQLGFTCAACHTTEITYRGHRLRIDGGSTLADRTGFSVALSNALIATVENDQKFNRFARRVLGQQHDAPRAEALRTQVRVYGQGLMGLVARNYLPYTAGYGRIDAFGLLFNEIVGTTVGESANYRVSNAPVSYPAVWNVPEFDWFQWNGCVNNPMIRNVIEVLGVFGRQSVSGESGHLQFATSIDLNSLYEMWEWLDELKPPKWPEQVLGKIDQTLAARGSEIYLRERCYECHANKPPYPMTDANQAGRRFIRVTMTPQAEVGTDPLMVSNFVHRKSATGRFAGLLSGAQESSAFELFGTVGGGFMEEKFKVDKVTAELANKYFQGRETKTPDQKQIQSYKAERLAGIWTTAPYLHNGSVANLYQLLLPPDKRMKAFYVGNREFDPRHVGFLTGQSTYTSELDTSLPGNSNSGHTYGTQISDDDRWALVEFLKTL